jgi:hypothetical protein
LGVTGLSPTTVNAGPAWPVGRAEAAVPVGAAEVVGLAEPLAVAETVVTTGAGPVGVGVAEQPADSAATAQQAATAAAARVTLVI